MRSIIVPTTSTSPHLLLLINSLLPLLERQDEVLVVYDDRDSTAEREHRLPNSPPVKVAHTEKGFGFAAAVNTGISLASGNFLYLVNADIIIGSTPFHSLEERLHSNPRLGIVSPALLYPQTNAIQHVGIAFSETNHCHIYSGSTIERLRLPSHLSVQAIAFAFCCLRRETFQRLGLLDEAYINGYEDLDYCLRIRSAGLDIEVDLTQQAWHWERHSGSERSLHRKDNSIRLWREWGDAIQSDLSTYVGRALWPFARNASEPFVIVNLAVGTMQTEVLKAIRKSGLLVEQTWNFPQLLHKSQPIHLPLVLPPFVAAAPRRLLIIVDRLKQLKENHYWFALRRSIDQSDLLVDLCGSCMAGGELLHD